MFLWRISNHTTLDGRGGLETSARWHTQGRLVVYLAETPAGALVEALIHLELNPVRLPKAYRLLKVNAPDGISMHQVAVRDLPKNWARDEIATQTLGDEWLASKSTALLRVPSAIVPETFNVLLNPAHGEALSVRVASHREYPWDLRLIVK